MLHQWSYQVRRKYSLVLVWYVVYYYSKLNQFVFSSCIQFYCVTIKNIVQLQKVSVSTIVQHIISTTTSIEEQINNIYTNIMCLFLGHRAGLVCFFVCCLFSVETQKHTIEKQSIKKKETLEQNRSCNKCIKCYTLVYIS